jgi:glyoxylase I family protein
MGAKVWEQEAGQTVFDPCPETSKYFGDPAKVWMLNFRVRDLDKMAAQLQAAAIAIKVYSQTYPNGRFARLHHVPGFPSLGWPRGSRAEESSRPPTERRSACPLEIP